MVAVRAANLVPTGTSLFSLSSIFKEQNVLILMYSNVSIFPFMVSVVFGYCLRNLSLPWGHGDIFLHCLIKALLFLLFTWRALFHLESHNTSLTSPAPRTPSVFVSVSPATQRLPLGQSTNEFFKSLYPGVLVQSPAHSRPSTHPDVQGWQDLGLAASRPEGPLF